MSETAQKLIEYAPPPAVSFAGPRIFGPTVAGLFIVLAFFGGIGGWAALAPLSSGAVAQGTVRVDSHRKTVQHLEGGIIAEILVRDGDVVKAGQPLVKLDSVQSDASADLVERQYEALKALEARLIAERDNRTTIAFPPDLAARRTTSPRVAEVLAGQETIFATRRKNLDDQVGILKKRIDQAEAEIGALQAQSKAEDEQLKLIDQEIGAVRKLYDVGLERLPRLLSLQRAGADIKGRRDHTLGMIARARQGIGETELQIVNAASGRANEIALELREAQQRIGESEERIRATTDVKTRRVVVAPLAGTVVNSRFFTIGGVVSPGAPILDIVPAEDRLIVESRVQPIDIDFVRRGLKAQVRFTGLSARRTPTLEGSVASVSADTLIDERTGETYYSAMVEIGRDQLARIPGVTLYPGMPADVLIEVGARTALDYIVSPIRDSMWRSFRQK